MADKKIPTHYVTANIDEVTMTVRKAEMFGTGLEVICRYRAVGSFLKRYGAYCEEGQPLDAFVEVTLKDDDRNDPPINKDGLAQLGILSEEISHIRNANEGSFSSCQRRTRCNRT